MVSIEVRNASRRLIRPYFSKLGWLAKVIWPIAFSIPLTFYEKGVRLCGLIRGSLDLKYFEYRQIVQNLCIVLYKDNVSEYTLFVYRFIQYDNKQ
jgi:hypothetical protein